MRKANAFIASLGQSKQIEEPRDKIQTFESLLQCQSRRPKQIQNSDFRYQALTLEIRPELSPCIRLGISAFFMKDFKDFDGFAVAAQIIF